MFVLYSWLGALNKVAAKMKTSKTTETHPLSATNKEQSLQSTNQSASKMENGHATTNNKNKKGKAKDLMMWYASSLGLTALSGGFAVLPAIALGGIFSKIGAESRSPQFVAMILLLGCYLSDFWLCEYGCTSNFLHLV